MTTYFTTLWKNAAWDRKEKLAANGYPELNYVSANGFKDAGVHAGSVVFVVTVREGKLYVGGRIVVAEIVDRKTAATRLVKQESELWKADDYVIAEAQSVMHFQPTRIVPIEVARALQFVKGRSFTYLKFESSDRIDRQTLRAVRRLYPGSEIPLLELIRPRPLP